MTGRKWGCKVCKYHYRDGFLSGQSKTYDNLQKLLNAAKASSFSFDLTIPEAKEPTQLKDVIALLTRWLSRTKSVGEYYTDLKSDTNEFLNSVA